MSSINLTLRLQADDDITIYAYTDGSVCLMANEIEIHLEESLIQKIYDTSAATQQF
jgi:hypothetical protein